ncbi:SMI1/KNR4 family protein [Aliarcobacter butzleri]|uniref:SMI1/KNR4 family protein n=1 Tax=Aliarcobacter butzleri TaxID=28197 RepID=UPI00263F33DA|nr:SMI1/KNR4 family protein [Aliarcobacter butzleri]MDN5100110.1 SMI1/KNR4 family protein [Aliarcobacter butzleri]
MKKLDIYRDEGIVNEEIIEEYENKIGYKFPIKYKELLSKHNAIRFEQDCFDFLNIYNQNDERDISFYAFQHSYLDPLYCNGFVGNQIGDDYFPKELVDFGGCANGDIVCFDYRDNPRTDNPKIVLVYHDDYIENEDGASHMVVNFVANSFEEFIDMLYEYKE